MFQSYALFPNMTVHQNVAFGLKMRKMPLKLIDERVSEILQLVGLTDWEGHYPSQLSGGQQQRVALGRALAIKPKVLLLDEPFAGVDPISVVDIQRIIEHLCERDIGVLITDHNVRETLGICDRAYIISEGRVLTHGTPDAVLADEDVRKVYLGKEFRL